MKIRAATRTNGQDLAIRVNAGDIIAIYTLIIAATRLCASRNVFHTTPPLYDGLTASKPYFHCNRGNRRKKGQEGRRMAEQMEILLKAEKKTEAEEVLRLLDEMTQAEQEKMLVFMQGVKFAKGLGVKTIVPATQTV